MGARARLGAAGADAAAGRRAAGCAEFAAGFGALARAHEVALVGGDTTAGRCAITVQLLGLVPRGAALRRAGARAGDALFVSAARPGMRRRGWQLEQAAARGAGRGARLSARALPRTRRRAWRSASGCAATPAPASTCRTGCRRCRASLRAASGCGASSSSRRCRCRGAAASARRRGRARAGARAAATTTSCASPCAAAGVARLQRELPPRALELHAHRRAARRRRRASVTRDGTVMEFSHSGYRALRLSCACARAARAAGAAALAAGRVRRASQSSRAAALLS